MTDDHLTGWLVIMRGQPGGEAFYMPDEVNKALEDKGWIETSGADHWLRVTDLGCAVSDLAAPEWGIDSLAVS